MNNLIGNTPLIEIFYKFRGKENNFYAKLEYYNFTGSIKDRVVYNILNDSIKNGTLKDNQILVEATSGNTGISLAALGALLKHKVYIFMPDWISKERIKIMENFGAVVTLVSKEEGGFKECIKRAYNFSKENDGFLLNQFSNLKNTQAHYQNTAVEIDNKLGKVDGFISGIGTGGTLMGIGTYFKDKYNSKIIALEPVNMSLLKLKTNGSHIIEGIGDEFIPDLVNREVIDEIITLSDEEVFKITSKLAKELGLGVGFSSGANALATIIANKNDGKYVTVFVDDNKKYLSNNFKTNTKTIVDEITFTNFKVVD